MNRLQLNVFSPLDSKEKIDRFLKYLLTLKSKDRYRFKDCITLLKSDLLQRYFWEKAKEYLIFSNKELVESEFFSKKEIQQVARQNKEYIAKGVKASEFNMGDGFIAYNGYRLESRSIKKFSKPIRSKIDHSFILVKNYTKNNSFLFEPISDLMFLLSECRRISKKIREQKLEKREYKKVLAQIKKNWSLDSIEKVDAFIKHLLLIKKEERLRSFDTWLFYNYLELIPYSVLSYFFDRILGKATFIEDRKIISKIIKRHLDRRKSFDVIVTDLISKFSDLEDAESQIHKRISVKVKASNLEDTELQIHKKILAEIKASDLKIEKGIIRYGEYSLKSVRINAISKKILSKIDHLFKLKVIDTEKRSFIFEPANDLSFLLAESERIREQKRESKENDIPSEHQFPASGEFELPWCYVEFKDRILYLSHPNQDQSVSPYSYRHISILKSFRDILPYIEKKCPLFQVIAQDNTIINVSNLYTFEKLIPQFNEYLQLNDEEIKLGERIGRRPKFSSSISIFDFRKRIEVEKSKYLHFLSEIHVETRPVFYILENVVHTSNLFNTEEHGYLFTIRENDKYSIIVYENIIDESRSSIVFCVERCLFDSAVDSIRRFWASDIKNKRQKLLYNQISFGDKAIYWRRISHDYDWEYYMKHAMFFYF